MPYFFLYKIKHRPKNTILKTFKSYKKNLQKTIKNNASKLHVASIIVIIYDIVRFVSYPSSSIGDLVYRNISVTVEKMAALTGNARNMVAPNPRVIQ